MEGLNWPWFPLFPWSLPLYGSWASWELAGLQFNIVNIILSALIFGLGDDYSLFIMDGLLQEYKTGKKNLSSYKSSIVLSAITTLAGLGVLIFARHPALRSIALISITGILSVVLIAQVLIPFFFNFLIRNRVQKGLFPLTAVGLFKSVFSLSYFALGSLLVTGFGFILVKWNPFPKSRARHFISPHDFCLYLVCYLYHGQCEKENHQSAAGRFFKTRRVHCQSPVLPGYPDHDHAASQSDFAHQ